ncbi:MAG: hypothetical protein Q4E61_03585 [Alphaproteobacteria bacterium]|nr:hypothetical protein [Alphaproteobacteria bacterium]
MKQNVWDTGVYDGSKLNCIRWCTTHGMRIMKVKLSSDKKSIDDYFFSNSYTQKTNSSLPILFDQSTGNVNYSGLRSLSNSTDEIEDEDGMTSNATAKDLYDFLSGIKNGNFQILIKEKEI